MVGLRILQRMRNAWEMNVLHGRGIRGLETRVAVLEGKVNLAKFIGHDV